MQDRREILMALSMLAMDANAEDDQTTIYIPERQTEKDRPFLLDFMEEYAFAMIVSSKGGLRVTNVPTLFERSPEGWGKLWWHISKNNLQNNAFDGNEECIAVFHGPHAYISPNWYKAKNAVPTWNFAVVHATGKPKRIDNDEAFAKSLKNLVATNEGKHGGGDVWDYSKLPDSYLKGMRQGIVAYEMTIDRVEAKFKLGHERSAADREGTLQGLATSKMERNILELTRDYYKRNPV